MTLAITQDQPPQPPKKTAPDDEPQEAGVGAAAPDERRLP